MSSYPLGLQASFFSPESNLPAQPSFDFRGAFLRHRGCDNLGQSSRDDNDCHGDQGNPLTVSGNTVNTGRYTIAASTDGGGTLTVTDNKTGESFKVWGDPHITTDNGDTTSFQHAPATFQLPDGTEITVDGYRSKDGLNSAVGKNLTFVDGKRLFLGGSAGEPPASEKK